MAWTFETMPVAVKVRHKMTGRVKLAQPFNEDGVAAGASAFTYREMFDLYEQLDGKPCGELANECEHV